MRHINRREFLTASGTLTLGFALRPDVPFADSTTTRPNILFIMADDHTSQAWGCYGSRLAKHAPTRNIDRIRKEGALLSNCFCTNSICVPSRASILTGQYSHINGANTLAGRLAPETDTVVKHLQAAGYETALVGKWHLKDQPAGFDYYNVLRGQGRYHDPILFESGMDWKKGGRIHKGHSTDVITDKALAWLNKTGEEKKKPFCLMVHYKAVHEPFYSDDRFRSMFENEDLPEPEDLLWPESPKGKVFEGWPLEILGQRYLTNPKHYSPPALKADKMNADEFRKATYQKFIKDYLRTVAGIDDNIGRLLTHLDKTGQNNNTVVIYTSDQGYFLGEHNLFDKRFFLEESLRMPFVVRYPAEIKPGTTIKDIVLNIDFAELFLDYAGVKIPEPMQGRSFRKNLQGKTPPGWRDAMYYRYWSDSPERPSHYGVRTHTHKLIYYDGLEGDGKKPDDSWELYDLKADPHEYVNIYGIAENKDIIKGLKKTLKSLREEFRDIN
jgi:arylsulfatase A-like enzyme